MNGIIAAAFWTSTFFNPISPIYEGISARTVTPKSSVQISNTYFQNDHVGQEVGLSLSGKTQYGPLRPLFSGSITNRGGLWIGAGFENTLKIIDNLSASLTFMPGVYSQGGDKDLGGWLMFRSGIGMKYELSDIISISIDYDHRSSGDIWEYNPGMETIQIKFHNNFKF